MIEWIKDYKHLEEAQEKNKGYLILAFYAGFSPSAKRVLVELENFSKENENIPIYVIDVEKVRGVHKQFEVKNVPTVLAFREGRVTRRIEGVESARFYARIFSGGGSPPHKSSGKTISHRVVVYSG